METARWLAAPAGSSPYPPASALPSWREGAFVGRAFVGGASAPMLFCQVATTGSESIGAEALPTNANGRPCGQPSCLQPSACCKFRPDRSGAARDYFCAP
ncbi:DUF6053 domain-containing protein [Lysobacter enzymogenes]|uniref:DUF6053 domain-containing protein n=1 Tax=Lysobacter enzymogenes TaxID=69 RepID=UPI003D18E87F